MKNPVLISVVAVSAAACGDVAGYFFAKDRLTKAFKLELDEQILEAKKYYGTQNEKPFSSPEEAVKNLIPQVDIEAKKILAEYQGGIDEAVEEEQAGIVIRDVQQSNNIFDQPPIEVDLGTAVREPSRPYEITVEEFLANEKDWAQNTVTYYAGDRVLADERDEVMDQPNQIVGHHILEKLVSTEDAAIYCRNEKLSVDFEILLSQGKYSVEVAGFNE